MLNNFVVKNVARVIIGSFPSNSIEVINNTIFCLQHFIIPMSLIVLRWNLVVECTQLFPCTNKEIEFDHKQHLQLYINKKYT